MLIFMRLHDDMFVPQDGTHGAMEVTPEFKALLNGMLDPDPEKRLSFEQVFEHPWMQKPDLRECDLKVMMRLKKG